MRQSRVTSPAVFYLAVALSLVPGTAAAQDPRGHAPDFADTLDTRVLPLPAMLRTAPGWARFLRDDPVLRALAAARAARVPEGACAPSPRCLADAWLWTDADVATMQARLRVAMADRGLARALVTEAMRPSGRFARHAALPDADLLATAWADTAAAMNRVIAVYARGDAPRYPRIDASILAPDAPQTAMVLAAHGAATAGLARADDLPFDPVARYVIGLLRLNERIDAGSHRPLLGGENADAARAVRRTSWRARPYSALLVFGHGPEDAQSRTGVLGHVRLAIAVDLFARGLAPFVIVSGGNVHPNRTPFNEAVEMKRLLVTQYDVPADRILIEPHARHTTTNLRNCARLLLAAGFPADRPALVVSDPVTIKYIGNDALAARNVAETGVQPGRLAPGPNRLTLAFTPDPVAFHVEATDPLDP